MMWDILKQLQSDITEIRRECKGEKEGEVQHDQFPEVKNGGIKNDQAQGVKTVGI